MQSLARLEELVRKIVDLVNNRVEGNLSAIRSTLLVDLPADRSFTFEEFVSTQSKFQKRQAETLSIKNEEIRRSIEELVTLVKSYPRENPELVLDENEVNLFRRHYSKLTYQVSPCLRPGYDWLPFLEVCLPAWLDLLGLTRSMSAAYLLGSIRPDWIKACYLPAWIHWA